MQQRRSNCSRITIGKPPKSRSGDGPIRTRPPAPENNDASGNGAKQQAFSGLGAVEAFSAVIGLRSAEGAWGGACAKRGAFYCNRRSVIRCESFQTTIAIHTDGGPVEWGPTEPLRKWMEEMVVYHLGMEALAKRDKEDVHSDDEELGLDPGGNGAGNN
jgi:hypothetical protein